MPSMMGSSAWPFSVNAYSTRGGTSGNVWRSTMPSSSSARSRSERVRGEMPASERSSSQNRERPSARSRITSSVHLPHTMSAVRQTGQSRFGTNPSLAARLYKLKLSEGHVDHALLEPADDGERQRAARGLERVEEVVEAAQGTLARGGEEVAALDARAG